MESGCLTLKKLVNLNSNFMQFYTLIFAHNLYDDICIIRMFVKTLGI